MWEDVAIYECVSEIKSEGKLRCFYDERWVGVKCKVCSKTFGARCEWCNKLEWKNHVGERKNEEKLFYTLSLNAKLLILSIKKNKIN